MDTEALDRMATEGAGIATDLGTDPTSAPSAPDRTALVMVGTQLGGALGNLVCRRANVTHLMDHETRALGEAIANVLGQYDLGQMDPRAAAWLGLGMTVLGIAAARQPLPRPANGGGEGNELPAAAAA